MKDPLAEVQKYPSFVYEKKIHPKISIGDDMDHCLWKIFIWQVGSFESYEVP